MERCAVFFTDLDSTLIYSHRHPLPEGSVQVETLHDRPQSFMTRRTWDYFRVQPWFRVIPVTTRTVEQYRRLEGMAAALGWEEALVCNGAVRLAGGREDPVWREESLALAEPDRSALDRALDRAAVIAGAAALVTAEPFLFYVKTAEPERVFEHLRREIDPGRLQLFRDARKVYVISGALTKGRALQRAMAGVGGGVSIAAGDSGFDISMLRESDICFCPKPLAPFVAGPRRFVCGGSLFSDEICSGLERIGREELQE